MIFVLQQYAPDAIHDGEGMIIGLFSTINKAKEHSGQELSHWEHCSIDTQSEAEAWQCGQWHITMMEVS